MRKIPLAKMLPTLTLAALAFAGADSFAQQKAPHPCTPDARRLEGLPASPLNENDRQICLDHVTAGHKIFHGYGKRRAFELTGRTDEYGEPVKRRRDWGVEVNDPAIADSYDDGKKVCQAGAAAAGKPATACQHMMSIILGSDGEKGVVWVSFYWIE